MSTFKLTYTEQRARKGREFSLFTVTVPSPSTVDGAKDAKSIKLTNVRVTHARLWMRTVPVLYSSALQLLEQRLPLIC